MLKTEKSYRTFEQVEKYAEMYRSIGYKEIRGRVPKNTIHKITLRYLNSKTILYYIPKHAIQPILRCPKCGGTNILARAWVNANTNEFVSDIDPCGRYWCEDCHEDF